MFETLDSTREQPSVAKRWALIFDGACFLLGAAGIAAWIWKVHHNARYGDVFLVAKLVFYSLIGIVGAIGFALDLPAGSIPRRNFNIRSCIFVVLVAGGSFINAFR